jgi:hypothetical protein
VTSTDSKFENTAVAAAIIWRWFLLPAVVIALGWASIEAGKMGLADLSARQVDPAFVGWRKQKVVASDEWDRIHQRLLYAESLQPSNADYQVKLGQLFDYRWMTGTRQASENGQDVQTARDYYRAAVAKRVIWGYAWAHLLSAKARLNELDDEFTLALDKAVEFAPWEPPVQLIVSDAAFLRWDNLTLSDQEKVRANTLRGLKSVTGGQTRRMIKLIRSYDKYAVVCPSMPIDSLYERVCPD